MNVEIPKLISAENLCRKQKIYMNFFKTKYLHAAVFAHLLIDRYIYLINYLYNEIIDLQAYIFDF